MQKKLFLGPNYSSVVALLMLSGVLAVMGCSNNAASDSKASNSDPVSPADKPKVTQDQEEFVWDMEKRKAWAERQNDSQTWNMESFGEDLSLVQSKEYRSLTKPVLTWLPTPHSKYSNWGGGLSKIPLKIENKTIRSALFTWCNFPENRQMFEDPSHDRAAYLNLHILTDTGKTGQGTCSYSSRNFPHILFSGKYKTSVGDVDFVAMGLGCVEQI